MDKHNTNDLAEFAQYLEEHPENKNSADESKLLEIGKHSEDFIISSVFPKTQKNKNCGIEYRVKVFPEKNEIVRGYESVLISTNIFLKKDPPYSMFLKESTRSEIHLSTQGFINPRYRGRLFIKVANVSDKEVFLPHSVPITYIVFSAFNNDME